MHEKLFYTLGCNPQETQTLLALFDHPEGVTVVLLSRLTGLARTTLYGHLESLLTKGLVVQAVRERGTVYFAQKKEYVVQLYQEKIDELTEAKVGIDAFYAERKDLVTHHPRFTLYKEKNFAENIFRDMLRVRPERTCWFWPVAEMVEHIPSEAFDMFMPERVRRGIQLNVLWPKERMVDIDKYPFLGPADPKESKREVRILPKEIDQFMGYGVYDTKVAFISTRAEGYGFIIDSQELSQTIQLQFDYLWKQSKPYSIKRNKS